MLAQQPASLDIYKKCSGKIQLTKNLTLALLGIYTEKTVIHASYLYIIDWYWVEQSLTTSIFCLKSMDGLSWWNPNSFELPLFLFQT